MIRVHATCIAIGGHGVLLRGTSGAGKSDLALRLLGSGGRLVADDYTDLYADQGRLRATAPPPIRGLMEVRGLGILRLDDGDRVDDVAVATIIDLVAPDAVPRVPEPNFESLLDVVVPRFELAPLEASAVDKVRLAVRLAAGEIRTSS